MNLSGMESDLELSLSDETDDHNAVSLSNENKSLDNRQMKFVSILKQFPVILNKSQTPLIKKRKKEALITMCGECLIHLGENLTESKVLKKLNNMKTELKKKTDKNSTGNKTANLKPWERIFLELLEGNRGENPSIRHVPGKSNLTCRIETRYNYFFVGATSSGVSRGKSDLEHTEELKSQVLPPPPKKKRLSAETEETRNLTTGELQRLVLLEQLKLIRLQQEQINNNKLILVEDSNLNNIQIM